MKMEAGADFVMTQPFFDVAWLDKTLDLVGDFKLPILMGILPLQKRAARRVPAQRGARHHHPRLGAQRMHAAGANGRQEGVRMAQELCCATPTTKWPAPTSCPASAATKSAPRCWKSFPSCKPPVPPAQRPSPRPDKQARR